LQAISNWFAEDDATGFVNPEGHTIDMAYAIANGKKLT